MPRFNTSTGRQSLVSLKQKKSLAEAVNDQLTSTALGHRNGNASGYDEDGYADGGVAEDYDFDEAGSSLGSEEAWGSHGQAPALRSPQKAAKEPSGKRHKGAAASASPASRLRHRGPLDASLSEGKYAATPVSVEAAMDDIFGALDMGDMDAEGEELYDDDMDGGSADDVEGDEAGSDAEEDEDDEAARGRKRRRAKDLTEDEYAAWLEKKRTKQPRRPLTFGGDAGGDAVMHSEEADILRQLSELRQAQVSLVPGAGDVDPATGAAAVPGDSSASASAAAAHSDAEQTRATVQHYIMVYGQLLRLRVLLQPAVTKAISMPQYYARSLFVARDAVVEAAAATAVATSEGADGGAAALREAREDVTRLYAELQDDLEGVLATLFAAATTSSATGVTEDGAGRAKRAKTEADVRVPSYREVERYHERVLRHADTCLDYWGSKLVQANSAKLKTIAQPLPQQIATILSAKSRLRAKVQKNRSHLAIMGHPEHVRASTSADVKAQRALHIADGDVDDEIYDDVDFMRELVRRGGAVANQLEQKVKEMQKALLPSREGARKGFHRMTKGKAVNYEPRPKLVGFMMAEPLDETERNDVVVKNLFQ